jgi:hypothetical protein
MLSKKRSSGTPVKLAIFVIAMWLICFYGWIVNCINVVNSDFNNITGLLVVRAIGIVVAPIGSFMGLFF